MTVTEFDRHANRGLWAGLQHWFTRFNAERAQRARYADVYDELMRLSDRDLSDIGISRSDVRDIARQAAFQGA